MLENWVRGVTHQLLFHLVMYQLVLVNILQASFNCQVCVSMHACMSVCTCLYMHACVYVFVCMHVCVLCLCVVSVVSVYACMQGCIVCAWAWVCIVCVYVRACACACLYVSKEVVKMHFVLFGYVSFGISKHFYRLLTHTHTHTHTHTELSGVYACMHVYDFNQYK